MNPPATHPPAPASARTPPESWSRSRWVAVILLAFIAHIGFITSFGELRPAPPRAVRDVPSLRLAAPADELLALDNPTLFARPQRWDFFDHDHWRTAELLSPPLRWTQTNRWLTLSGDNLGEALDGFLRTHFAAPSRTLDFKPAPEPGAPGPTLEPSLPQNSTLLVEGDLARRLLPADLSLTSWPYPDVLAPCTVQVLVDPAGNVVSAALLPSDIELEATGHSAAADQRALEIARALRFAPAPGLTLGRVTFHWHTIPPASTP